MDGLADGKLSGRARLALIALALALAAPLVMACLLTPDRRGSGTHQQLGLPPCTFKAMTGWPCPSCGMTTSWAHVLRGEWSGALRANVGGTLLCLAALAAVPWMLVCAGTGRWWPRALGDREIAALALLFVMVTLVDWLVRLAHIHS